MLLNQRQQVTVKAIHAILPRRDLEYDYQVFFVGVRKKTLFVSSADTDKEENIMPSEKDIRAEKSYSRQLLANKLSHAASGVLVKYRRYHS